jgi:hypothetical protein
MASQAYNWTCSICATTWVLNATGTSDDGRQTVGEAIGYPSCVNEAYGCMSSQCLIDALYMYGLIAKEKWVDFNEAFSIAREHTGLLDSIGMYHYMAIRGVDETGNLWVANSAPGYMGVWDYISRDQFNAYGPWKVIYIESSV